jgi:hypothetical protein
MTARLFGFRSGMPNFRPRQGRLSWVNPIGNVNEEFRDPRAPCGRACNRDYCGGAGLGHFRVIGDDGKAPFAYGMQMAFPALVLLEVCEITLALFACFH